jgi:hypothetical protein
MDLLKPFKFRLFILFIMLIMIFAMFIGRGMATRLPLDVSAWLTRIGYIWIALLTYTVFWSVICFVLKRFSIYPTDTSQRLLFFYAEVLFCIIILAVGIKNAETIHTIHHPVETQKGISMRVVMISDMHLGYMNVQRKWQRIINQISDLNPDIVLLTGDFFENENGYAAKKDIARPITQLNPRFGIWAVMGNHEYIAGGEKSLEYFQQLGVTVLRDSSVIIEDKLLLIGQEDPAIAFRGSGKTPKTLCQLFDDLFPDSQVALKKDPQTHEYGIETALFALLMTHQVKCHKIYQDKGLDLVISGHTHDGQFFPWNLLVKKLFDIGYGFQKRSDSHFFVSSGTGIWGPPIRFATKSEIVVFDIN